MLIQTCQLDIEQLTALDVLCDECKITDNNVVTMYRHLLGENRHRPSSLMYFDEETKKMIGFLGAFFFLEGTCEIALMVAPDYRRQGIASQLLKAIFPLTQLEDIRHFVFSSPHGLNDNWFSKLRLQYQHSEFEMRRSGNKPISIQNNSVKIQPAKYVDIPTLCAIDEVCFPKDRMDGPTRVLRLLNDPVYCLFVVKKENEILGKAHINWQPNVTRISDLAIIPNAQGCGLGSALLTYCIHYALTKNKVDIVLDVETANKQALSLYTRHGFSITNAYDYWGINEFGLTGFLHRL